MPRNPARLSLVRPPTPSESTPPTPSEPTPPTRLATQNPAWLNASARELAQRLNLLFPPTELGGLATEVARLLAPIREVVVCPLPDEDKVRLEGELLRVDSTYPLTLGAGGKGEERLRQLALYVAHEVAHVVQGISDKTRVLELHASEGEDALLWIDLEADHAAARYCQAILGVDLLALKHLQLQSLAAFPIGPDHRPSDRLRKARRAADLAADIEARTLKLVAPNEIAQLLWPRGGGVATVIVHGAFRRRLCSRSISARDASVLDAAANKGRRSTKTLLRIAREVLGG